MSAAEALKAARAVDIRVRDRRADAAAVFGGICAAAGLAAGGRAGGHRRVRWRIAARPSRGSRIRLLHRGMAEPQPRALAAGALSRLRRWRSCA